MRGKQSVVQEDDRGMVILWTTDATEILVRLRDRLKLSLKHLSKSRDALHCSLPDVAEVV